jgi:hypothetical protein
VIDSYEEYPDQIDQFYNMYYIYVTEDWYVNSEEQEVWTNHWRL